MYRVEGKILPCVKHKGIFIIYTNINAARNIKDRRSILINLGNNNLRERLFGGYVLYYLFDGLHAAASNIGLAGAG